MNKTEYSSLVMVRVHKALLALTVAELLELLRQHPEVWTAALRRGKAIRRAQAAARRGQKAAQSP